MELAKILAEEPEDFQTALQQESEKRNDFSKARSMALSAVFESEKYQQLLSSPNNILGIESVKLFYGKTALFHRFPLSGKEMVSRKYSV